jgi:plasmid stabilization system protein ParE
MAAILYCIAISEEEFAVRIERVLHGARDLPRLF